jgi:hypothetical protein
MMEKVREVIAYQGHFENFLRKQTEKVQNKIYKVIEAIETFERVPETYLKAVKTKKDFWKLGYNCDRIFGEYFVFLMKIGW